MALKRTEIKRTKAKRKHKRNEQKKERREARKLQYLERKVHYLAVCEKVDERDKGCCQECGAPFPEHHHIKFRSQSGGDDIENLVSLCPWCHKYSPTSPHQSREGRLKWVVWAMERYPIYWAKIHESQKIRVKGACS